MSDKKILVTGGTGKTGRRIAKRLTDLGYAVRIANRTAPVSGSTNEHVVFDWYDETTHEPADRKSVV